jgi:hypothetical protein
MLADSAARLAAELAAWMPPGVDVVDHPPDTRAPPFVYLRPARHYFRQGVVFAWDVVATVDGGRSPADRAAELYQLFDLILAAAGKVAVLAECISVFGTSTLGDVGNPTVTVTVPIFHATCELPQAPAAVPLSAVP